MSRRRRKRRTRSLLKLVRSIFRAIKNISGWIRSLARRILVKMFSRFLKKCFVFLLILGVALCGCSPPSQAARADDDSELKIKTTYNLSSFKPIGADNNYPSVYIVRIQDNDDELILVKEYVGSAFTGTIATIDLIELYNLLNANDDNGRLGLCVGWLKKGNTMLLQAIDEFPPPNEYYYVFNSTLLTMNNIGTMLTATGWRVMDFITTLMHYTKTGISVMAEVYTPTTVADEGVEGGITTLVSSIGSVLRWFWDKFGLYVTLAVLSLACGAILWARGSASGGD